MAKLNFRKRNLERHAESRKDMFPPSRKEFLMDRLAKKVARKVLTVEEVRARLLAR